MQGQLGLGLVQLGLGLGLELGQQGLGQVLGQVLGLLQREQGLVQHEPQQEQRRGQQELEQLLAAVPLQLHAVWLKSCLQRQRWLQQGRSLVKRKYKLKERKKMKLVVWSRNHYPNSDSQ